MSLVMNLVMAATPPERAGSAASLMETCGELGIAMGVATLGTLVTAIYRGLLPGALPTGTSHSAAELAAEGVSSAPAAAAQSPDLATQIVYAAQSAFTDGYNVVGVLAGIALLATAVAVNRVLGAKAPEVTERRGRRGRARAGRGLTGTLRRPDACQVAGARPCWSGQHTTTGETCVGSLLPPHCCSPLGA